MDSCKIQLTTDCNATFEKSFEFLRMCSSFREESLPPQMREKDGDMRVTSEFSLEGLPNKMQLKIINKI